MAKRRRYLRLSLKARDAEEELREEIESHIAERADDLVRQGLHPARARAVAAERFGDPSTVYRSARNKRERMKRDAWIGGVKRDVLVALRQARSAPGATLTTVVTLALAVGLTTTMYTLVDRVLMRELPYPAAERLVFLQTLDSLGNTIPSMSQDNWHDLNDRNATLAASAIHMPRRFAINNDQGGYRVDAQLVSEDFFDVLRAPLVAGRGFAPDDADDRSDLVVISEGLWERELGRAPLTNASLMIEGQRRRVIGVVASDREYPSGTDAWVLGNVRRMGDGTRNNINWTAIARLRDGVSAEAAQRDLDAIAKSIQSLAPGSLYFHGARVTSLQSLIVGDSARYLTLLLGAVLAVLLLACANLAGLNFARTALRGPEVALRLALGAGRGRVLRQLVTEQIVIALIGGALGVLLAIATTRWAVATMSDLPRAGEIRIDLRVLLFALVITILSGLIAGIAPAWRATKVAPKSLMSARGVARGGRGLPGASLVMLEVAVAIVLLVGGTLVVRSFRTLIARDLGYDTNGVVIASVTLNGARYQGADGQSINEVGNALHAPFWSQVQQRLTSVPGVQSVALANWILGGGVSFIDVEGTDAPNDGADYRAVSDEYFTTMRIPLIRGRSFNAEDRFGTARVGVINRTMAESFWPGQDPIGKRVMAASMESIGGPPQWITVVGVAADVRDFGYENGTRETLYTLYRQVPFWMRSMNIVVRGRSGEEAATTAAIRNVVRDIDPALVTEPSPIRERVRDMIATRETTMNVLAGFSMLALALAAIGIYSLLSFSVAQRTREIGVRTALGADHAGIIALVLRNAMRVVLVGAAIGLLACFWLTKLVESILVDVSHLDPVSFVIASIVLLIVALAAACVPAWRASKVNPLEALRA